MLAVLADAELNGAINGFDDGEERNAFGGQGKAQAAADPAMAVDETGADQRCDQLANIWGRQGAYS